MLIIVNNLILVEGLIIGFILQYFFRSEIFIDYFIQN